MLKLDVKNIHISLEQQLKTDIKDICVILAKEADEVLTIYTSSENDYNTVSSSDILCVLPGLPKQKILLFMQLDISLILCVAVAIASCTDILSPFNRQKYARGCSIPSHRQDI